MKKIAALAVLLASLSSPVLANEFIEKESSRSGVKGTFQMIGNSVGGFFSVLGALAQRATGQSS